MVDQTKLSAGVRAHGKYLASNCQNQSVFFTTLDLTNGLRNLSYKFWRYLISKSAKTQLTMQTFTTCIHSPILVNEGRMV